jgi:hypothetical protein
VSKRRQPLRVLHGIAPSGGHIELVTYDGLPGELNVYNGKLTPVEDDAFQAAVRRAYKGGLENWQQAGDVLHAAGWTVLDATPLDR